MNKDFKQMCDMAGVPLNESKKLSSLEDMARKRSEEKLADIKTSAPEAAAGFEYYHPFMDHLAFESKLLDAIKEIEKYVR